MNDSLLSTTPRNTELCLLCNGQFSKRGNDARVINSSGWQNLKSKAEVWSQINVPILNELYNFTQVHDKVKSEDLAFGRRHERCRIKFSSRLTEYLNNDGEKTTTEHRTTVEQRNIIDCSNERGADTSCSVTKPLTRSSGAPNEVKSCERKCFVCVEVVRECETNAYNCGGLGRCEKDSASENIQRAENIFNF